MGELVSRVWEGKSCSAHTSYSIRNAKAYVIACADVQLLPGALHAPHSGYSVSERPFLLQNLYVLSLLCPL